MRGPTKAPVSPPIAKPDEKNPPTHTPAFTSTVEQKRKIRSLQKLRDRERAQEKEKEARLRKKGVVIEKRGGGVGGDGGGGGHGRDRDGRRHASTSAPTFTPGDGTTAPKATVQVVVLPLYWRKEADGQQKRDVLAASRIASEHLKSKGWAIWVDMDDETMPGHKFKKWEEQGVRVRVEIGPRDVAKSVTEATCVVSLVTGVGQVADKATVDVGSDAFFERIARGVGRPPKLKPRPYEAPALPDTQPPRGKEEIERATSSTVRVGRKKGAKSLAPAGKKTIFTSGDAEDDFDI